MSKTSELEVFSKHIAIPGCAFSKRGVKVERTEEAFRNAFGYLSAGDQAFSWWWGDVLVQYCDWQADLDGIPEHDRGREYVRYSTKWAAMLQREAGTVKWWCQVARFYESASRLADLSWSHYQEAMAGSDGDLAVAQEWLDKAVEHNWSKTELRKQIRLMKRAEAEPEEPAVEFTQTELFACVRWSKAAVKRVPDMPMDEKKQLLATLQPILQLAMTLASEIEAGEIKAA